jgi:urease accessory protein UreE
MELTEITKVDQIEVTENNDIQVRTATIILKDDVELTRTFHRHVLSQGDDITNEDSKVIAIANAIWV